MKDVSDQVEQGMVVVGIDVRHQMEKKEKRWPLLLKIVDPS